MSAAPVTMASLADARLEDTQSRLTHLWTAAHSPLAQQAPVVASLLLRSLRKLAAQSDCQVASSHQGLSFCPQCCQVRLPGVNTQVRVEASESKKARERQRRRKRARSAAAAASTDAAATSAGAAVGTSGASSPHAAAASASELTDSDPVSGLSTPRKRRRESMGVMVTPFKSPFAGADTPAAKSGPSALAAADAKAAPSSQALVLHCLACSHRTRLGGQSGKQKQLLRAAPSDMHTLVSHTAAARQEHEAAVAAIRARRDAEADARDSQAKKAKLLHSLQSQLAPPPKAALRASQPAMQQLAQAQQRLRDGAAIHTADPFFSEQLQDATGVVRPLAAAAASLPAASPPPPPPPATPAAPFTFSRSGAGAGAGSAKKPSLAELLRGGGGGGPSSTFSSNAVHVHSKGGGAAQATPASSIQGVQIFSGIKIATAAAPPGAGGAKGFSFTKQTGKNNNAANQRKSR